MQYSDDTPTEELEVTVRTANAMIFAGIKTVGQLRTWTDEEILRIPNVGRKTLLEIRQMLCDGNICFRCSKTTENVWAHCAWCGTRLGDRSYQGDKETSPYPIDHYRSHLERR